MPLLAPRSRSLSVMKYSKAVRCIHVWWQDPSVIAKVGHNEETIERESANKGTLWININTLVKKLRESLDVIVTDQ